ncbi:MAG: hypothetical protein EHM87_04795 [Burkholderiales bacterium]|nr:MAG: hypothetical protein EHM87_04795 [Burkholderiales bacterium]
MRRRTLLKAGLVGGALLAAAGGAAIVANRDPHRDRDAVLGAVVPALLDGALPSGGALREAAVRRCTDGVVAAIAGLAPSSQAELAQLFALLGSAPGRRLLAGVHDDWHVADTAQVGAFLQSWRQHRFDLFRGGYAALHDLVIGTWYADPDAWPAIGYAGPLPL